MEKKKLKLEELEVNSFLTSNNKMEKATIEGGVGTPSIVVSIISVKITWDVIDSLLYGECPTKGDGAVCTTRDTGDILRTPIYRSKANPADCYDPRNSDAGPGNCYTEYGRYCA